jgi:NitT/TauT family transport system substrate-binding protein
MNFKHAIITAALMLNCLPAQAADKFNICWSHYAGWEPYGILESTGILAKWEAKYGIDIEITLINDYVESLTLYTSGEFDACTMTNMDALTIPAASGKDSTAIILGDHSNGSDGIVLKNGKSVSDLKGRTVDLVEFSVSHYLLARALEKHGMSESDVTVRSSPDADMPSVFRSGDNAAVVTWNPPLQTILGMNDATLVFDSSDIPEEIQDLLVVRSDVDEKFKKAITGAWFELMQKLNTPGSEANQLVSLMAANAGATDAEFRAQLKTTAMFYKPDDAFNSIVSANTTSTMDAIRKFAFDKGLFGHGAPSADFVGIKMADGEVLGDPSNITLRFDASYIGMAKNGLL